MIEIKNVSKKFGNLLALDDVTLTINDNECFSLLGFNGAGKTTLINILTTSLSPSSGNAFINGLSIKEDKNEIKKIINVSPQEVAVGKNLTVKENLDLIASLYDLPDKNHRVEQMILQFDLQEKKNTLAKKLSGGQLRRLSIALAVITQPKVLFLDEPTLGLDIKARRKLWETIKLLKEKMTIVLTTHYLDEVETLTDRIAIISNGKIMALGTKQDLLDLTNETTLEDAFLKIVEEE